MRPLSLLRTSLTWTWKLMTALTVIGANLALLMVLLLVLAVLVRPTPKIPDNCALVLELKGDIVEQRTLVDPLTRALSSVTGSSLPEETLLQDVLDVLETAADDRRISILVLRTDQLTGAGLNQLLDIARAMDRFKAKGKLIVAVGRSFSQGQYFLAAHADEIYLDPMGAVSLQGFGVFRLYFKELLDRLRIKVHVFRVGAFKSALEPFLRRDMSPAARQANSLWLNNLWSAFCRDIARQRGIKAEVIDATINHLDRRLEQTRGDMAQMALQTGLIDGLKNDDQVEEYLAAIVGRDEDGRTINQVTMEQYLATLTPSYTVAGDRDQPRVGIIVAEGDIVSGEGGVGQIGADTLVEQIRKAREDEHIRALVLRINSGGGSALASEQIRRELARTREEGKPVVVSMGALAASGAYWLSVDADAIIASPLTLTGSIGIFGALPTVEDSLARIGIHDDGVGTTKLAGQGSPTRALSPVLARALQLSVENGYRLFITTVARGRNMPPERVEELAQGRVWDGDTAAELGLVDETGSLEEAVRKAAHLAGLEQEKAILLNRPLTLLEQLDLWQSRLIALIMDPAGQPTPLLRFFPQALSTQLTLVMDRTDPRGLYAFCPLPRRLSLKP